ncbi:MAG: MOSC domain-containing protein [Phycisphaerae bacterium]|nr:MOSC domain-containing protein [Phycisphaerae bacterium]
MSAIVSRPHVARINISRGGVPKAPVPRAGITVEGVEGDAQADRKHHGGPDRAVSLFSLELIEKLRGEGHPIAPGTTGENLTISGVDWASISPGARLRFAGGVELEITSFANPCATIRDSFRDLDSRRIKQEFHPGESRLYARVLKPGTIESGETFVVASSRS